MRGISLGHSQHHKIDISQHKTTGGMGMHVGTPPGQPRCQPHPEDYRWLHDSYKDKVSNGYNEQDASPWGLRI